jgi:hypothetical protein
LRLCLQQIRLIVFESKRKARPGRNMPRQLHLIKSSQLGNKDVDFERRFKVDAIKAAVVLDGMPYRLFVGIELF